MRKSLGYFLSTVRRAYARGSVNHSPSLHGVLRAEWKQLKTLAQFKRTLSVLWRHFSVYSVPVGVGLVVFGNASVLSADGKKMTQKKTTTKKAHVSEAVDPEKSGEGPVPQLELLNCAMKIPHCCELP